MEARGVPAVVLGTDAFTSLAVPAAVALGTPHLPFVTVAHPLGGIDPSLILPTFGATRSVTTRVAE